MNKFNQIAVSDVDCYDQDKMSKIKQTISMSNSKIKILKVERKENYVK